MAPNTNRYTTFGREEEHIARFAARNGLVTPIFTSFARKNGPTSLSSRFSDISRTSSTARPRAQTIRGARAYGR
jgi:hypothetical protein